MIVEIFKLVLVICLSQTLMLLSAGTLCVASAATPSDKKDATFRLTIEGGNLPPQKTTPH